MTRSFIQTLVLASLGAALFPVGCGSRETASDRSESAEESAAAAAQETPGSPAAAAAIDSARTSLKAGNFDAAAAELAKLQMQGAAFNAQQAKDYRQTLSEAYDRAIEGAQRGDPRAQAALQMLRAAAPR